MTFYESKISQVVSKLQLTILRVKIKRSDFYSQPLPVFRPGYKFSIRKFNDFDSLKIIYSLKESDWGSFVPIQGTFKFLLWIQMVNI